MKTAITAVLALFFAQGAMGAAECPTTYPQKPRNLAPAANVVYGMYEAVKNVDFPAFFALLSDDVTWTLEAPKSIIPAGGTYHGKAGVQEFFAAEAQGPQLKYIWPSQVITQGNSVVVVAEECVVDPKTNEAITHFPVIIYKVKAGKVVKADIYVNVAPFLPQPAPQPQQ